MPALPTFHTDTALARGLRTLLEQLQQRLSLRGPLNVYIAGGMAVHLYTAGRVTTDVDAEFGGRVHLPDDLAVEVTQPVRQQLTLQLSSEALLALPD